ncbi:MAG TPA: cation:proton antiporter [Planctomycetota bacterium]|jgi:CPA2 family monovalent cation:H+ antiporter-2
MHDLGLIPTLAIAFSVALILGYLTHRMGLSPILGYLLAGVVVGPHTPGYVADAAIAGQLAEVGVILLMFGVGLHFHVKDLVAVRRIALPGAIGQSLVATGLGLGVALAAGWGFASGIVLGLAISVASTVVLTRVLVDNDALDTPQGHIAVGWLIVEDIFTVLVLVLLPMAALSLRAEGGGITTLLTSIGIALGKLAVLAVLVLAVGGRVIGWLLTRLARARSRELFTLAVLAFALSIAAGSAAFFGASMALGAFLAGMVVGQSRVSDQAAADALPMRDAFAVLFFVSVGMLFDPRFVLAQPGLVLAVLAVILVAKPAIALLIVLGLGYSVRTALTVAIGLAQIGEFSFILADGARKLDLLPAEGQSLLVAGALLSIGLNPLLFRASGRIELWLQARPVIWGKLNRRAEARGRAANAASAEELARREDRVRAIVVGYGPVGQTAAKILEGFGIRPVVIDLNVDTVTRLVASNVSAIYGDAGKGEILKAAGVDRAKYLVVTLPDESARTPVIAAARQLNPGLHVVARARYLGDRSVLEDMHVASVCFDELEAAAGLSEIILRAEGMAEDRIAREMERIRGGISP